MAKLIYVMNASLDGYVEDANGDFGWGGADDKELWSNVFLPLVSSFGTYLYGRRMYETMVYWETAHDLPQFMIDFPKHWRNAEKIVYSKTLAEPRSARTTIEREFDPITVARLKANTERDIGIMGPELASQAIRAGLVDEIQVILYPVIVGSGKRFLPEGVRLNLVLIEERRFRSGALFVRYGVRRAESKEKT